MDFEDPVALYTVKLLPWLTSMLLCTLFQSVTPLQLRAALPAS